MILKAVHARLARLLLTVGLCLLPGLARATEVYGDFDHDGVGDIVTQDPARNSVLHVWLSATGTLRELRTKTPIYRVAAVDLDGDGRPEIVASDTSAVLHVWRSTRSGRLREVTPHRSPPRAGQERGTGSRATGPPPTMR